METTLKKFRNSIVLIIPEPLRKRLNFFAGQMVTLEQKDNSLIVKHSNNIKYTLEELLSQCDFNAPFPKYDNT